MLLIISWIETTKLKDSAMITEDKVTEIFCIADDFCKVFDAQMAKYSFKAERKRKYHRESWFFGFKLHQHSLSGYLGYPGYPLPFYVEKGF